MTTVYATIPARGGSKRLPRKNIARLGGKPMLVYTVEATRAAGLTPIVVTEDDEIAAVGREAGARIESVDTSLTGDLVASWIPCAAVARRLGADDDSTLVCLQPSSPLRTAEDISAALRTFRDNALRFLVSVTPIDPHYFHWALHRNAEDTDWEMVFGDRYLTERPLLPPVFRPNGAIKIARLGSLVRKGSFFGEQLGVSTMPEDRSVHVATRFDLQVCATVLDAQ